MRADNLSITARHYADARGTSGLQPRRARRSAISQSTASNSTPKHGSWLNLVESFFSKLARSVLRHIRVASKQELKDRIVATMDFFTQDPRRSHLDLQTR
jgi:hypothetical protein